MKLCKNSDGESNKRALFVDPNFFFIRPLKKVKYETYIPWAPGVYTFVVHVVAMMYSPSSRYFDAICKMFLDDKASGWHFDFRSEGRGFESRVFLPFGANHVFEKNIFKNILFKCS